MMAGSLDFYVVVAYTVLALSAIALADMFQWFCATFVIWLGVSYLGAGILPGIWGATRAAPLFFIHVYLIVSSVFFFIGHWCRQPDSASYCADERHVFLSLFAVSNLLMALAAASLATLFSLSNLGQIKIYVFPAMLELYVLKPVYWFVLQAVLMAVFYIHRRWLSGQSAARFSMR